jgi:hypothetical protein
MDPWGRAAPQIPPAPTAPLPPAGSNRYLASSEPPEKGVVLGVENPDDVEWVFDLAGDLTRQQLLELEDAASAYRDTSHGLSWGRSVSSRQSSLRSGRWPSGSAGAAR